MIKSYFQSEIQLFCQFYLPSFIQDYQLWCLKEENEMHTMFQVQDQDIWNKYCYWIDSNFWNCNFSNQTNEKERWNKHKTSKSILPPRVKSIDFNSYLQNLIEYLDSVPNPHMIIFRRNFKGTMRLNASTKRSSFIGVNKNGPNWQTLITISRRKTYVGTFLTEVEAAKAYDFYSMLINWEKSKTNFSYNKEQAFSLISEFSHLIS